MIDRSDDSASVEQAHIKLLKYLFEARLADPDRVRGLVRVAAERSVLGEFMFNTSMVKRTFLDVQEPLREAVVSESTPFDPWALEWPPKDHPPKNVIINERRYFRIVDCAACTASGEVQCPTCKGSGSVSHPKKPGKIVECKSCSGRGTVSCMRCKGAGRFREFKQIHQTVKTENSNQTYPTGTRNIPHGTPTGTLSIQRPLGFANKAEVLEAIRQECAVGDITLVEWIGKSIWSVQEQRSDPLMICGWTASKGRWFEGWHLTYLEGEETHEYFVPDSDATVVGPALRSKQKVRRVAIGVAVSAVVLLGLTAWGQQRTEAQRVAESTRRATVAAAAAATAEQAAKSEQATATTVAAAAAAMAEQAAKSEQATAVAFETASAGATVEALAEIQDQFAARMDALEAQVRSGAWRDAESRLNEIETEIAPGRTPDSAIAEEPWMIALGTRIDQQSELIDAMRKEANAIQEATTVARRAAQASTQEARDALASRCGDEPLVSPWDGMAAVAKEWLKSRANDPGSIDVEGCTPVVLDEETCWIQVCDIRGNNVFGAKVLSRWTFSIANGVVIAGIEN